ncbi:MAG TPA: hypothetical protein VIK33_10840 [Anaerolineae bacterium]
MDQLSQTILVVLVAIVLGWFAFGMIWNIRRGNAVLRWMQGGLPRLGERTTLRWLGSSAVHLSIAKAQSPFRQVDLLLVMEPRDVPWFWILAHARGRRDVLIVRGQLASAPRFEFDLLAPGSWSERQTVGRGETHRWDSEMLDGRNFRAPQATRSLSRQLAPDLVSAAQKAHPTVWRLSSRREVPQIELHVPLPDPRQMDARQFFEALRTLAEHMSDR